MGEISNFIMTFTAGILLGIIFYGGLWLTISKGLTSKHPAIWFFSSLIIRTVIALSGIYIIGNKDWKKLILCLIGFIVARFIVNQFVRATKRQTTLNQETSHAP